MKLIDMRGKLPRNPDPNRKYRLRNMSKVSKLVIHCTNGNGSLVPLARYFVTPDKKNHISKKGLPEFAYHFWINHDGNIYYCTDVRKVSWHAGNWNPQSIGVALRYKADGNPSPPNYAQLYAAQQLIYRICIGEYKMLPQGLDPDNVMGHRELPGTGYKIENGVKKLRKTCPGMLVSMTQFRYELAIQMQQKLADLKLYKGAIDGLFGPKSEKALMKHMKGK
jgi:N-acetyl-anhydromuramyl-L-alanine amidase AmpD